MQQISLKLAQELKQSDLSNANEIMAKNTKQVIQYLLPYLENPFKGKTNHKSKYSK